jgi:protein involved in sex pheromone biosynthesis
MKKVIILNLIALLIVLTSCNSIEQELSEEQAKSILIEHHTSEFGEVKIKSIKTKFNKYIIEWENNESCEYGTDIVNKKGEVKAEEYKIC